MRRSELSDKERKELAASKKNYTPQSQPQQLADLIFKSELGDDRYTSNNKINVVSDIHSTNGRLPFTSSGWNILAGDLSDSHATDTNGVEGIAVIGNHEIVDTIDIPAEELASMYVRHELNYAVDWRRVRVDNVELYESIKTVLTHRYSGIHWLNNEAITHSGVRYIGLTIPLVWKDTRSPSKKEYQRYIFPKLFDILGSDNTTPTVIISHAPLCNEFSLHTTKGYNLDDTHIMSQLAKYNIVGFIHGHHHIRKTLDFRSLRDRRVFVICSIYSDLNHGLDLWPLLHSLKLNNSLGNAAHRIDR